MFSDLVVAELARARAKHRGIASFAEGYGVLAEEVHEVFECVCAWQPHSRDGRARALAELVQVAAMASRVAEDVYAQRLADLSFDAWSYPFNYITLPDRPLASLHEGYAYLAYACRCLLVEVGAPLIGGQGFRVLAWLAFLSALPARIAADLKLLED